MMQLPTKDGAKPVTVRNDNQMKAQPVVCDLSGALLRMGGDAQLLKNLAEFFREDAPQYLDRLRSAADEGNAAGVRQAAHSLHGLVANFGAEAAAQAAWRLEAIGQSGDLSGVAAGV